MRILYVFYANTFFVQAFMVLNLLYSTSRLRPINKEPPQNRRIKSQHHRPNENCRKVKLTAIINPNRSH